MLVYDITKQKTYESVNRWMEEVHEHATDQIVIMLVGNKSDLRHSQAIPTDEVKTFATEQKLLFAEASALDATNVEELFQETIARVHRVQIKKLKDELAVQSKETEPLATSEKLEINNKPVEKKCCQS